MMLTFNQVSILQMTLMGHWARVSQGRFRCPPSVMLGPTVAQNRPRLPTHFFQNLPLRTQVKLVVVTILRGDLIIAMEAVNFTVHVFEMAKNSILCRNVVLCFTSLTWDDLRHRI